jgi:hypothetical protein
MVPEIGVETYLKIPLVLCFKTLNPNIVLVFVLTMVSEALCEVLTTTQR